MADSDSERGLYRKFRVSRREDLEGKHDDCEYFVLDLVHDRFADAALLAYAKACETEYPMLAADLRMRAAGLALSGRFA